MLTYCTGMDRESPMRHPHSAPRTRESKSPAGEGAGAATAEAMRVLQLPKDSVEKPNAKRLLRMQIATHSFFGSRQVLDTAAVDFDCRMRCLAGITPQTSSQAST